MRDIRDVDAFVHAAISKLSLGLSHHDEEELAQEGFLIMCELERRFTPKHAGTFSGYATARLPQRLINALHKQQGHVRRRRPEGRVWELPTVSLDAELELLAA